MARTQELPDPGGLRTLIAARRNDIEALARRYRVSNIRVFGSVARGDHRSDSDVDFLIDLPDDASLFDIAAFQRELRALLGVRVDVVSSRALLPRDEDVLEDAVAL